MTGPKTGSRPPESLKLTYEDNFIDIPIQKGQFAVPPDVFRINDVTLEIVVGQDLIRISGINGNKFLASDWTLVLEDRQFSKEFRPLPKEAKARSSCVLVFESATGDGTVLFSSSCRTRRKIAPQTTRRGI
jgi:hypothetical protein